MICCVCDDQHYTHTWHTNWCSKPSCTSLLASQLTSILVILHLHIYVAVQVTVGCPCVPSCTFHITAWQQSQDYSMAIGMACFISWCTHQQYSWQALGVCGIIPIHRYATLCVSHSFHPVAFLLCSAKNRWTRFAARFRLGSSWTCRLQQQRAVSV